MCPIRTVIRNRRIEVSAPDDLPDGTEVFVELVGLPGKTGLDESEWRDDPAALSDWANWLDTIEPVSFSRPDAFDEEFRCFNLESVRKQ